MLNEKNFYDLSLLSYFDIEETGISVSEMIQKLQSDEELKEEYNKQEDRKYNFTLLQQIQFEEYSDMIVKECFNDNQNSGIVYYIFETEEALIFAFRGSEAFDDIHHKTEWQDWKDNFRMFLKDPTWQQLYTLHQLQNTEFDKSFYLCGHSKGGNLALYTALTMKQELQDKLVQVISFNAPGITKEILSVYKERASDPAFLKKLFIFENENDCISAFFEALKEPIFIKSSLPCNTIEELYHNHNLYAMDFRENAYIIVDKKTVVPRFFYHFINDFFVNRKEEKIKTMISKMDEYFDSTTSLDELLKKMLVDVSRYVSLFEDIPEEEMMNITLQELIQRRKTNPILGKVKDIQPKETLQKVANNLNDVDIKEITSKFVENYELMVKEKAKEFHIRIQENNEKIIQAIRSIRNREYNEE